MNTQGAHSFSKSSTLVEQNYTNSYLPLTSILPFLKIPKEGRKYILNL